MRSSLLGGVLVLLGNSAVAQTPAEVVAAFHHAVAGSDTVQALDDGQLIWRGACARFLILGQRRLWADDRGERLIGARLVTAEVATNANRANYLVIPDTRRPGTGRACTR